MICCATSPEGRKQIMLVPDDQLAQMGHQAFADIKQKTRISNDSKTKAYVQCVAQSILHVADPGNNNWEIVVFEDPQVNAFALPGRKIGVYTGILKVTKNADQLAAVLGHEVGHVLAKHGAERVSALMIEQGGLAALQAIIEAKQVPHQDLLMGALGLGVQVGIGLPHSRTQEAEADIIGLRLMAKAGFEPQQAIELWKNMGRNDAKSPPEFLSDHPAHSSRISNLQKHLPEVLPLTQSVSHRPSCSL